MSVTTVQDSWETGTAGKMGKEWLEKAADVMKQGMNVVDIIEKVQEDYALDVWADYLDWIDEKNRERETERKTQVDVPVKVELLKQKVRDW